MTSKFDSDFALIASKSDVFSPDNIFLDDDSDDQPDDIIILHMDIREPLSKLKSLLEKKIGLNLKAYKFWLQNAQMLEPDKNLVDQCVEGEGVVQINVQIITTNRRINIVDVLKPTEEALQLLAKESLSSLNDENDSKKKKKSKDNEDDNDSDDNDDDDYNKNDLHDIIKDASVNDDDDSALKWILDTNCQFRKDQIKLKIPDDPAEWSVAHVQHWLQWAVREFNMVNIKLSDWNINGKELCDLSLKDFEKKVPNDPGNIFRTHFELLRKCKFIAILQNRNSLDMKLFDNNDNMDDDSQHEPQIMKKNRKRSFEDKFSKGSTAFSSLSLPSTSNLNLLTNLESNSNVITRNSSGQIQLWQFLLDLLTNYEYRSIIHWISADGEFRLANPEHVAKLWGVRKNKPSMNYEKLSRALRYYYDGDMISKVHGKRFVYKFVCDLKQLIGYDAREITRLINQCILNNKNAK